MLLIDTTRVNGERAYRVPLLLPPLGGSKMGMSRVGGQ